MTKIKICGLCRVEDAEAVNRAKADFAGFVFWPKSRRLISMGTALALREALEKSIPAVGVFVDQPREEILALLRAGAIDIAQLHGHEGPEEVEALRALSGKPVWKAFKVRSQADIGLAEASPADMVLLDNGYGAGKSFDWGLLSSPPRRPWMLAGGLTPETIPAAVKAFSPWGVDISSGVETDGRKDPEKIMAAAAAARRNSV